MITFDRPFALLFLPLVIAASVFSSLVFKGITGRLGILWAHRPQIQTQYALIKRSLAVKNLLWTLAFMCLVVAYAGPYWGSRPKTVQTSGHTVAMVFDISYSMTAQDMPPLDSRSNRSSRLLWAAEYALQLLRRLGGSPVSVVLAKGSGVLTVPVTEDYFAVESMITALSPQLLSSAGSDLGEGVLTAIRSFPVQSAAAASIILFTDGDETTASLENAAAEAARYGINLVITGFGSKNEIEITAGDGVTRVKTALREQNLQRIVQAVSAKTASVFYVNAQNTGSAIAVLNAVKPDRSQRRAEETTVYGSEPIPRFMFFLTAAAVLLVLGFVFAEFRFKRAVHSPLVLLVFLCFLCTSCAANLKAPFELLEGMLSWNRKNYPQAVASFLQAKESARAADDAAAEQYAQFALGTAYLMQNETEAATERFSAIPANAPPSILSGMWYNSGIIAHREGNYSLAADCFKKALLIDSTNLNAKINLELSIQQTTSQPNQGAQEMLPISEKNENNTAQDAVFSIIREKEQNQWKSQPSSSTPKNVIDY